MIAARNDIRDPVFFAPASTSEAEAQLVAAHHDRRTPFHDELWTDLIERRRPSLPHDHRELGEQQVDDLVDTFLTECAKAPDVGSTDSHRIGTKSNGLENIGAAADATVDEDGNPALHAGHNLR